MKDAELDPIDFHVFGEAIRMYHNVNQQIKRLLSGFKIKILFLHALMKQAKHLISSPITPP
ncbi:hypothetical protein [Gillisia sp. Hel1_33_143]|uniref:hypothetical protein n=1 Tax=Gillisia sp. Hel1_33_143 TaxID=1336796 RepID=UPI0012FD29A2|nr:hypothetical protein [Gillisia sp. Hel1_33_143]